MQNTQGEITVLLEQWRSGEPTAFDQLLPLVYPHLRQVAAAYMRRERSPGSMQATTLVHELYLRLVKQNRTSLNDRSHFYTYAAKVMRMILVDHARQTNAQIRGGGMTRVPLSDDLRWVEIGSLKLVELNLALEKLEKLDSRKAQLVEVRYMLGCTAEETAELLNLSKATVDRELKFVRSWLFRQIYSQPHDAAGAMQEDEPIRRRSALS